MNVKRSSLFAIGFLFLLVQTSCGSQVVIERTSTPTLTKTPELITILTLTSTPVLEIGLTQDSTADATQQIRQATALAIQATEQVARQQSWNEKQTQKAEFPAGCEEDVNSDSFDISPDGNWLATICGSKINQTLSVQRKNGTKWVLDFKDFLSPETSGQVPGSLHPKFWSPEGNYLFFTIELGYSGGGDFCFPEDRNGYGLFRLNLSTGSSSTLVAPTDSFPGYEMEFSPTGRRYAVTLDGVMITDLQTGETTKIATSGTVEKMSWSPDGKYLAFSTANCDNEKILSSSMYIWDVGANQTQTLVKIDGKILKPDVWIDNSTLRIIGQEMGDYDWQFTVYEYNIRPKHLLFSGTATPNP